MPTNTWIPDSTPLDMPSVARIYDYMLGGYHNFEIDRQVARKLLEIFPETRLAAQACRAFLRRVVNFLVEQGIDQFLDIGSGLPTLGNVHEVAQKANPAARVVYVDIDPVAVAHSTAMLNDNPYAAAIWADARQPDLILNHPTVKRLLDFSRPAAVLFITFLHYLVDDDQALSSVRTFRDVLAPGSYIAISHGTSDNAPPGATEGAEKLSAMTPTPSKYRTWADILKFFEGLELVEPGLVYIPLWHPEDPDDVFLDRPEEVLNWGGVGRKVK
jgi:hypothetical protein